MSFKEPLLKETGRGFTVLYQDKHLYSRYNPARQIEKQCRDIVLEKETLYLLASPLLGLGITILQEKLPECSEIFSIEKDENLLRLSLQEGVTCYEVPKPEDIIPLAHRLNLLKYRKVKLLTLNGGYTLYEEHYDKTEAYLRREIQIFWNNKLTLIKMGRLWIKNTLRNIRRIHRDKPFPALKIHKPLLLTGAGESLEHSLEFIRSVRDKIYLLTVDTALMTLLEADLVPDGVLALEAQYYNLPDFYTAKGCKADIIYDTSSYPAVPGITKGDNYYFTTKYTECSLLKKMKEKGLCEAFLPALGSVGITALYLAHCITSGPLFITGLDFSYQLGKTHSRGTPYHQSRLAVTTKTLSLDNTGDCLKRPLLRKPGKKGKQEITDSILWGYARQTEEIINMSDRILDISCRGLDIGTRSTDEENARAIIEEYVPEELKKTSWTQISESTVKSFLQGERDLLERISERIRESLDKKHNELSPGLIDDLKEASYLFTDFPELNPLNNITPQLLLRTLYTINRYKRTALRDNQI